MAVENTGTQAPEQTSTIQCSGTHPIHSSSLIQASFDVGDTSTHILPIFTTGHDFLHSCRHFFGLHLHAEEFESPGNGSSTVRRVAQGRSAGYSSTKRHPD